MGSIYFLPLLPLAGSRKSAGTLASRGLVPSIDATVQTHPTTTDVKSISLLAGVRSFCVERERKRRRETGGRKNHDRAQCTICATLPYVKTSHAHTHLITFSQVVLSSVAINRLCGRALANSFIESLVVTRKNAHTRSHGSDALPDSNTQGELQGCQGDPFPCQTLILCQRYLSIRICSHLHPSQFLPVSLRFALFYLCYIF